MKFEFRNKSFWKKSLFLMLPIVLQQLISIGINFMDNTMIGSFGETQIAAAAFGNQFYGVFQFICMGLGSGAVVMSSQFWGRRETSSLRTTAAIAMRVTLLCCVIFFLFSMAFPELILRIYTNVPEIISSGVPYLRIIGITFLVAGLSSTATYLIRCVGEVKIPLIGSAIAFALNIFFNWIFIFGKLGAPRLELIGAAVGTLIARIFEFCFIFGYFIFKENNIGFRINHFFLPGGALSKEYRKFSLPVLVSDTLLGISLTLTYVIVGHLGDVISAASSIVNSVVQVLSVLNMAMAGASAIVVGNSIGAGDISKAKREGNSYILISILFGAFIIIPLLLLENPYLGIYSISSETLSICHKMILCNCVMLPFQTMAYVISKGVLRGGGDTRFLLLADSTLVWFLSLPLGALAGFVWHLSPFWIYFLLRLEYPLKGILCFIRYCTGKWIKVVGKNA